MRHKPYIRVQNMLHAIGRIINIKDAVISGYDLSKTNKLEISADGIYLDLQNVNYINYSDYNRPLPALVLEYDGHVYHIPEETNYLTLIPNQEYEDSFDPILQLEYIYEGEILNSNDKYWRFIYPLNNHIWDSQIKGTTYHDDTQSYTDDAVIKIKTCDDISVTLFYTFNEEGNYLVIEVNKSTALDKMHDITAVIITTLSLILGYKYGGYRYIVSSDTPDFTVISGIALEKVEQAKVCNYKIFATDTYYLEKKLREKDFQSYAIEYLRKIGIKENDYYGINALSQKDFENLVNIFYDNNNLLVAADMITEATIQPFSYQAPFLYVALETITSALKEDLNNEGKTIIEKNIFENKFVLPLTRKIDKCAYLDGKQKEILNKRIRYNLNSPSNQSKLETPYNIVGYKLTIKDIEAIIGRNKYFHGRIVHNSTRLSEQIQELMAINYRLHKLCCILLLGKAGYNGYLLNNEVIFGMEDACKEQQPPIFKIKDS